MPYKYLEDIATADVAFKAWGKEETEMFRSCCDALMNIMIADLQSISKSVKKHFSLEDEDKEMLLFKFLQELVYLKDAQNLLLRIEQIHFYKKNNQFHIDGDLAGELINREKHKPQVDIKAVTMHCFQVKQLEDRVEATVVIDI